MTNKEIIENVLNELSKEHNHKYIIGCYSNLINDLSKRTINRIIENINYLSYTDIEITHKRKKYIIELSVVYFKDRTEIDLVVLTKKEYRARYEWASRVKLSTLFLKKQKNWHKYNIMLHYI